VVLLLTFKVEGPRTWKCRHNAAQLRLRVCSALCGFVAPASADGSLTTITTEVHLDDRIRHAVSPASLSEEGFVDASPKRW
jgi:hypothetical protein